MLKTIEYSKDITTEQYRQNLKRYSSFKSLSNYSKLLLNYLSMVLTKATGWMFEILSFRFLILLSRNCTFTIATYRESKNYNYIKRDPSYSSPSEIWVEIWVLGRSGRSINA